MASETKNKKWLGYAVYVVLVTVMLLYFLFPAQAVEEFLDKSISRIDPEFVFKAEKIGPWAPAGMRITAGKIYYGNTPGAAVFITDNFYIRPQILKLIRGAYSFELDGTAYKGDINGTLHFTGEENDIASEIVFRDFVLADYDFLTGKFKHRLTGTLSGEIEYNNESAGTAGGSGRLDLQLSSGQLQFQAPIFNISSVDLQSIKLEAKLSRRQITITRADLAGSEVNGSMTGSIQLHKDIGLSQLNLKGTLEPQAQLYKNHPEIRELLKTMKTRARRGGYSFTVTGTLGEPKFKLL